MEYLVIIGAVIVLPIAVGWLYGRNQHNPFTVKGRAYYNTSKED